MGIVPAACAGWRRVAGNEYLMPDDKKFDGYYWVKAVDHKDLWTVEYLNYKHLFIRKI